MSRRCDPADRIVSDKLRRPQGPQVTISMTRLATADIHDRQRTFQLFDELKAIILKFIFMYKILIHPSHPSESFIRVALRRAQGPPPAARSLRLGVGSRIAGHPGYQAGIFRFQGAAAAAPQQRPPRSSSCSLASSDGPGQSAGRVVKRKIFNSKRAAPQQQPVRSSSCSPLLLKGLVLSQTDPDKARARSRGARRRRPAQRGTADAAQPWPPATPAILHRNRSTKTILPLYHYILDIEI